MRDDYGVSNRRDAPRGGAAGGAAAGAATGAGKIPNFSQLRGSAGLPGCHSEGVENRRPEEAPGQNPSGAGTWVQPPDPVDGSRRENERKPQNPRDGRISARIPPFDAPFAPAGSPARVWLKSGVGSARRRAKLALREKGQGLPPAALKAVLSAGAGFSIPKNLEPELGFSGSAG